MSLEALNGRAVLACDAHDGVLTASYTDELIDAPCRLLAASTAPVVLAGIRTERGCRPAQGETGGRAESAYPGEDPLQLLKGLPSESRFR